MGSSFPSIFDVQFLDMHFWSYETNKKVTGDKLFKLVKYYCRYLWLILSFRPVYILYNISFYKLPFLKDFLFCSTGVLLGRQVVLHDHGQYVLELHEALPGWQKGMLRWMLRHSAASIIMGEKVRPGYDGLMLQERLFVVPGTVQDTKDLQAGPSRKDTDVNVLYFSHLSRDKGVFVAFDAVPFILQGNKDVRLTLTGPIENDAVVARLDALQKEFPGRISYLGYIDQARERTRIFRSADIFIFPTLRDVFGLVLLHAMAEGLPIVASREGTIPEILPDEDHGLLFEKGNAQALAAKVLTLVEDGPRRRAMGLANRERFEKVYSLEKYGAYMINAFKKIEALKVSGIGGDK